MGEGSKGSRAEAITPNYSNYKQQKNHPVRYELTRINQQQQRAHKGVKPQSAT